MIIAYTAHFFKNFIINRSVAASWIEVNPNDNASETAVA